MRTIKVKAGQTLADIAIQYYGKFDALFDIAAANYLEPTADIVSGQTLFLPDASTLDPSVSDAKTVRYFIENKLEIASTEDNFD